MWSIKRFNELDLSELEQILRLRQSIFIIEQKAYFEDIDGNDDKAIHIFNKNNNQVWAYVRLLIYDNSITLGRVTISKNMRGNGSGRLLLNKALDFIKENYPSHNIEIVAMSYLRAFYKSLGFRSISSVYIMDDHPHEDMAIKNNNVREYTWTNED